MTLKLIISMIILVSGFVFVFSGKTCMDVDEHFYHVIIDPAILHMKNDKYYAVVTVSCDGLRRNYPFTYSANGTPPWFPDTSVKIAKNRIKVCDGDVIFVGSDKCNLGKIKKEKIIY